MSIPADQSSRNSYLWFPMYLSALSEPEPARMRIRIQEAEGVLLAREHLLQGSDKAEELQALSATLLALRSLRQCLQSRNSRSAAA